MGEGNKGLKSEEGWKREGGMWERWGVEGSSAAWYSHVSLFLSRSADVCLSVRVYRRITLCKHWAFALNRQHRYSQLMFSLSGATPANHTLYRRATGKATGHSFIMAGLHCAYVRVHAHITMGLNYVWPSLISYHLSHVFWESTAAVQSKPPPRQLL